MASFGYEPVQARAMTKADIADLRRWHRNAVRRSLRAGYDIVYVYAGHALGGIHHFLSPRYNQRTDEYGGSSANHMRLLREILEETQDEVNGAGAVACRITVDELLGPAGIARPQIEELLAALGELPDLWDFVMGSWEDDSNTARFGPEGEQEQFVAGLKKFTTKPVVGVGRFTSPDLMVRQVRSVNTMEVVKIQRRVLQAGVTVHCNSAVTAVGAGHVVHVNVYTGAPAELAADSVLMVTSRLPEESLLTELTQALADRGLVTVRGIGDAWAPGTIAAAVWSGRRFAEEFDAELPPGDEVPFRREVTELAPIPPRPA